jgi:hypothetical protein
MAKHWKQKAWVNRIKRQQAISNYYARRAASESIPENTNVSKPQITADARITIKLKDQPSMTFSTYKMPWGGWSISPTLAGRKVQQVLLNYL